MGIDERGALGSGEHLSREELEKYLSSTPGDRSRAQIQEHLSRCSECRTRLVRHMDTAPENGFSEMKVSPKGGRSSKADVSIPEDVMAKVRNLPFEGAEAGSQLERPRYLALAAGFVAALIGVGLWWRIPEMSVVGPEPGAATGTATLRQADGSFFVDLDVILEDPAHGSRLSAKGLELAWQPVDGADHYTVQLLGPLGQILLKQDTRDTRLIPSLESTEPCSADQGPCFWYVTVHLKTGTSHDSQIRELWILGS